MRILKLTKKNTEKIVSEAVAVLKSGGLVVYPTETCYGVGVDATNQLAVDKLLRYKRKRAGKPLSIAVSSRTMAELYVEVNASAANLYENFLPGPLTIVSRSLGKVASGVESITGTLGVRIPDYELVLHVVAALGKPITASSANASYKKRPYKIADILENLSSKQQEMIDLVLDAGELAHNPPSTVVDTTQSGEQVLRQGELRLTNSKKLLSSSPANTRQLGAEIMQPLLQHLGYKSVIIALKGELGAGKTEFTKGVAKALSIDENIDSPTYTIENNYRIPAVVGSYLAEQKVELIHIDVWRLESSLELEELQFQEQIEAGNVFVIEWADKVVDLLDRYKEEAIIIWVEIAYCKNEQERIIVTSDYTK